MTQQQFGVERAPWPPTSSDDDMERVIARVSRADHAYEQAVAEPVGGAVDGERRREALRTACAALAPYLALHRMGMLGGHLFLDSSANLGRWLLLGARRDLRASGLMVRLRIPHLPHDQAYFVDGNGAIWLVEIASPGLVERLWATLDRARMALSARGRHSGGWVAGALRATRYLPDERADDITRAVEGLTALTEATVTLLEAMVETGHASDASAGVWYGRLGKVGLDDRRRADIMLAVAACYQRAPTSPNDAAICRGISDLWQVCAIAVKRHGDSSSHVELVRQAAQSSWGRLPAVAHGEASHSARYGTLAALRTALLPFAADETFWAQLPGATRRRLLPIRPARDEADPEEIAMLLEDMAADRGDGRF